MFIRYNETLDFWEYDSSAGQTGAGPWLQLPVDFNKLTNKPAGIPSNIAFTNVNNNFSTGQTINGSVVATSALSAIQYVQSQQGDVYLKGPDASGILLRNGSGALYIVSGDTATFPLMYTGVISCIGGQIIFPSTQIASSNANILDDYEEGSWTPSVNGDVGNQTGVTYTTQSGRYIKIGSYVACWFDIGVSSIGSGAGGSLILMGLPFYNNSDINAGGIVSYHNAFNMAAYEVNIHIGAGYYYAYFSYKVSASGGSDNTLPLTAIRTGLRVIGNFIYRTTQ